MDSVRKGNELAITIPQKWDKCTVDDIFKEKWKTPKKMLHELRMSKNVKVDGQEIPWNLPLLTGQSLSFPAFESKLPASIIPADLEIDIIYEDDFLLIANKPSGLETHPSTAGHTNTLLNAVAYYLTQSGQQGYIKHIHRLDKDTTGAVLFAKAKLVGSMLDKMLEEREIKRTYAALVEGIIAQPQGTINEKIGRDRHHATRRRVSPGGQSAITHYKAVHTFPKENMTLITCQLESGRTHQIRVHLSHIGHPLMGDILYGGPSKFKRQALHALKIEFIHPITEEPIEVAAPFLDNPSIFPSQILEG
ncbi:RluA family pseudouridine synthase [Peribacillus sp. SCS-155]|uniref:RluA family pseudouridine synthase n=1 Tax=Peribacillus sedimenti TaxID=3115297 RepID=UPI003905B301